jgi:hypothetical protein
MNAGQEDAEFDQAVRSHIYEYAILQGRPPRIAEAAWALATTARDIVASFRRLAVAHVLVLQRGGEILMANPFSAVPTPFLVRTARRTYFGNCIWDGLGIPAMLNQAATIETSCPCCATSMTVRVAYGGLEMKPGIVHFAIPAARWWEDIVFT